MNLNMEALGTDKHKIKCHGLLDSQCFFQLFNKHVRLYKKAFSNIQVIDNAVLRCIKCHGLLDSQFFFSFSINMFDILGFTYNQTGCDRYTFGL